MSSTGRCSVLIVEDDASIAEFVDSVLRDEGYEVGITSTGEDALRRMEVAPADVVLLDLLLPGMSGEVFLRELRQRRGRETAVIVMTAAREPVPEGVEATEGTLLKPFELADLLSEVDRVVAGRPCRR